jgi:hypothetical protein
LFYDWLKDPGTNWAANKNPKIIKPKFGTIKINTELKIFYNAENELFYLIFTPFPQFLWTTCAWVAGLERFAKPRNDIRKVASLSRHKNLIWQTA